MLRVLGRLRKKHLCLGKHFVKVSEMKILLIDDVAQRTSPIEPVIMSLAGADELLFACSGEKAAQVTKRHDDIEIAFLASYVDEQESLKTLQRVKEVKPELPVVVFSANASPAETPQWLASGASGFLLDDVSANTLQQAVDMVIQGGLYIPGGPLADFSLLENGWAVLQSEQAVLNAMVTNKTETLVNQEESSSEHYRLHLDEQDGDAENLLLSQYKEHTLTTERSMWLDEVSGLYNRQYFFEQLGTAFNQQARTFQSFALVCIDVKNFDLIQSDYDEGVVQALLREMGERIKRETRDSDIAARVEDGEFILALFSVFKDLHVMPFLRRVLDRLTLPYTLKQATVYPTVAVGASISLECDNLEDLVRHTNEALEIAKQQKSPGIHIYE